MRDVLPAARRYAGSVVATSGTISLRIAIAGVIGIAIFLILLIRLWALTVMNGSEYAQRAQQNQIRQLPLEAPRGAIVDRRGRPLVLNRPAREVVLNLQDVPSKDRERVIVRLAKTLKVTPATIRERIRLRGADTLTPVVIAPDITDDRTLFYLEERASEFPGVDIRPRYVRSYVEHSRAAHMLGQVGEVSPQQLEGTHKHLQPGDLVGQSGLEYQYDAYLRGTNGYRAIEVDVLGVKRGDGRGVPAVPGRNLRLTIDLDMQRATEDALREGIRRARATADGRYARAAAAVAIDPRNGEVLSLASFPTYDPSIFVDPGHDREITRTLQDSRTPLANRAIAGLYPPASTYKVVTSLAAMDQGFVQPDTQLPCPSSMEISGTVFNNWMDEALPPMDTVGALEVSCDTYYYRIALQFYNQPGSPLQAYSRTMGLGSKTGIDLPGEEEGVVPTPAWRKKTFTGQQAVWGPGHTVNLSIGQGDLLTTPLQMTQVFAAIANGGRMYEPRVAHSVEDPSGKQVMQMTSPQPERMPFSKLHRDAVHAGVFAASNGANGTATSVFGSFPVKVAGKTGTGEKPPYGDMAWFCAYAPAAAPTISACAIVENGGSGGSVAAPVVLRMFQTYFDRDGGNVNGGKKSD
jgi:penicillin-binding protein 2